MDLIIKYNGNPNSLKEYEKYSVHIMNIAYAVLYLPISQFTDRLVTEFGYSSIPKCYALTQQSLEESGVTKLRNIPALNLRGKGVIIGIIGTGIDYTNPVFLHKDGTTKILAIWDQSIDSENRYPQVINPAFYGTEYTRDQINEALRSENPYQIVPSLDENGHGTKLAGIAAGSETVYNGFSGVVPDADIIVVKLKQAKKNLTDFFHIPSDIPCYQENDMIWAIQYLIDTARIHKMPLSICIGLGTSQGAHDDNGPLNTIVSIVGGFPGVSISVSAGNEGNSRRHFYSALEPSLGSVTVELVVGENESGFSMELWGDPPMIYAMDITSPAGEYIAATSGQLEETQTIHFVFEQTIINIDYVMIEQETGKQVIILRFMNPTMGIWRFKVNGRGDINGAFHLWLPNENYISKNTYFLNSNPYTTITSPGNCLIPITTTAYNSNSNVLYPNAGKGYSTSNIINPDLAAPGVNLPCPDLNHGLTTITGSSAAAAFTTGITAMLLDWGIVRNNYPGLNSVSIKKFLMRGAKRVNNLQYPNRDWGYGIIDIYDVFNIFRMDIK